MIGWIFAIAFAALTLLGLGTSGRCSRAVLQIIGAALLLAIAGYGWQGSPGMAGKPVSARPGQR